MKGDAPSGFQLEMRSGDIDIEFETNTTNRDFNDIYSIPEDNAFHNYKFVYDHFLDQVRLEVDGTTEWSTSIGISKDLIMPSNIRVSERIDASGDNKVIFDNFLVDYTSCFTLTLSIELISFEANS